MKILLVDDHGVMRAGLRLCIAGESDWQVVAEAEDGEQAVRLADQLDPDIIVMDIAMPKLGGIEATRRIIANGCRAKIIILSMHRDREFVAEVLKAGARAYLLKTVAFEELVEAIRAVSRGRAYLSPEMADVIVEDYVCREGNGHCAALSILTDREREVLQRIAEGEDAKAVGRALGISDKTVHTFRAKIMSKLGLHSVAELTKYAIRFGLTSAYA